MDDPAARASALPVPTDLLLPPGSRLLHIGQPKTGTTSLQYAASVQREQLLRLGVCYPGQRMNHNRAVSALMERLSPVWTSLPDLAEWRDLATEVAATPAERVLISYEQITESDDAVAARFREELGDGLHVVITMRGFGSMLPSIWQQYVKNGYAGHLEPWLHAMLDDPSDRSVTPTFWPRHDLVDQLRRWGDLVGTDNLTVVVLDKSHPALLTAAFEGMLGLPLNQLALTDDDGYRANRGLSAAEVELLRAFNEELVSRPADRGMYNRLVPNGAIAALQRSRRPGTGEGRIDLPPWAVERAAVVGREFAEAARRRGVRVIGDLDQIAARESAARSDEAAAPLAAVREVEVIAMRGLISRAIGRGIDFQSDPAPGDRHPTARALRGELRRRMRLRFARPRAVIEIDFARFSAADLVVAESGPDRVRVTRAVALVDARDPVGLARLGDRPRWIRVEGHDAFDPSVRRAVRSATGRGALVILTLPADGDLEESMYDQALAAGESRPREAWRTDRRTRRLLKVPDSRRLERWWRTRGEVVLASEPLDVAARVASHLGVEPFTLVPASTHRTLTAEERQLVGDLNRDLADRQIAPRHVYDFVRSGAIAGLLAAPPSAPGAVDTQRALAGMYSQAIGAGRGFGGAAQPGYRRYVRDVDSEVVGMSIRQLVFGTISGAVRDATRDREAR
jgi:hypothetical protein